MQKILCRVSNPLTAVGLGLAFAALLLAASAARASEPLQIIKRFSEDLSTYSSGFTQQVYDDNGLLIEASSGTMALSVPDRLCWRYIEPFEQWIIADGERIWTWDVDLEQVTVKDQDTAAGDSPLYLLMAPERLADSYRLVDRGQQDGLSIVALLPLEPRADFEWVELGFADQRLERLVIQDAFGQQTVISLRDGDRNRVIDPQTFQFEPPEGADVLGAEELTLDALAEPD